MKCPFCNHPDSKVVDSRTAEDGGVIRRRRSCESCGERFTTYERLDAVEVTVVKRDGTRETFDRAKIANSIIHACDKRKVTAGMIEKAVSEIESHFSNALLREIPTKEIGEQVMEKLRDMDEVAYIRFASVYRQFKDVDAFINELTHLMKERKD